MIYFILFDKNIAFELSISLGVSSNRSFHFVNFQNFFIYQSVYKLCRVTHIDRVTLNRMGKKAKGQTPPVTPLKAYFLYRNEIVDELRSKHPKMNNGDLTELMSNKWDDLPKEQKKVYEDIYKKNMEKYKKDVEQYQKKYGKMEPVTQSVALSKPKKSKKKPKEEDTKQKQDDQDEEKSQNEQDQQDEDQQQSKNKKQKKKKNGSNTISKKKQASKGKSKQSSKGKKNAKSKKAPSKDDGKKGGGKDKKGKKQDDNYRQMWVFDKNLGSGNQEDD